jgi:predicted kinase
MAGMASIASSQSEVGDGLYTGEVTEATYRRLFALMPSIINAGYIVIVDATFLQRGQRRMFSEWAHGHDVPFAILSVAAPPAVLRERITRRAQEKADASEANLAVLEHQLNAQQPFAPEELASVLAYEPNAPLDETGSAASWRAWLKRAGISLA